MAQEQIINKIEMILNQLRPAVQMDGGDIEFVSFKNGIVALRLHGACVNCPMSFYTLKLGIEQNLREAIPSVIEVVAVD